MSVKTKVLLAAMVLIFAMGSLIVVSVAQTASYYLTVDEFSEQKERLSDRPVRISGFIDGGSVDYDEQNLILRFDIQDEERTKQISVVYEGVKPDTFIDGWEAIVEGRLNEEGVFEATELLVKCPSKYEGEEYDGYEQYKDDQQTDIES
ncbi:CcmE/CycJ protein [Caldalkalibacillus thermarum TA2.A1]|uniref:CcmE/CycJ protein n=1 Tax=Caldalkalibacillus thermarum (strain TA2.A1) TaxID=986075 RepID=F5L3F6_CALTT|nr:cytochrome c maturation protein CcmE [Caldalkalibacillus thermarum]EGL84135.1 CcmE/CycJ protein [Caldalkalibacillus thermarum TA2.A1]QZT35031.1 cytochrome c maturation protein CcmE [Caldalkalibacillus thermarum TA2.A1]